VFQLGDGRIQYRLRNVTDIAVSARLDHCTRHSIRVQVDVGRVEVDVVIDRRRQQWVGSS